MAKTVQTASPLSRLAALASLPDPYPAACFCVPTEQVAARRQKLGLGFPPTARTAAHPAATPDRPRPPLPAAAWQP